MPAIWIRITQETKCTITHAMAILAYLSLLMVTSTSGVCVCVTQRHLVALVALSQRVMSIPSPFPGVYHSKTRGSRQTTKLLLGAMSNRELLHALKLFMQRTRVNANESLERCGGLKVEQASTWRSLMAHTHTHTRHWQSQWFGWTTDQHSLACLIDTHTRVTSITSVCPSSMFTRLQLSSL